MYVCMRPCKTKPLCESLSVEQIFDCFNDLKGYLPYLWYVEEAKTRSLQ